MAHAQKYHLSDDLQLSHLTCASFLKDGYDSSIMQNQVKIGVGTSEGVAV